jgi:hypothetical protein
MNELWPEFIPHWLQTARAFGLLAPPFAGKTENSWPPPNSSLLPSGGGLLGNLSRSSDQAGRHFGILGSLGPPAAQTPVSIAPVENITPLFPQLPGLSAWQIAAPGMNAADLPVGNESAKIRDDVTGPSSASPLDRTSGPSPQSLMGEPSPSAVSSAPPIEDDPFTRAAIRTRQSVRPEGGRLEGPATFLLENYLPHAANQLRTLPERAFAASERLRLGGDYDPAPAVETALWTTPLRGIRGGPSARGISGRAKGTAVEQAQSRIQAFRSENILRNLFGDEVGTISWTKINGKDIFGSSSRLPTYKGADHEATKAMRTQLIEKYPELMKRDNVGQKPNDGLFHAEATVLLRAARENGGTLAGKTIEIHSDAPMCRSCRSVLPYVGLELGNPTVTFIDQAGRTRIMKNGKWLAN